MAFVVRPASEKRGDVDFLLKAHDAAVVYLQSIGSQQWGSEPFSTRTRAVNAIQQLVRDSEEQRKGDQLVRTFVAETDQQPVACAAASVGAQFPSYVKAAENLATYVQSSDQAKDYLYLDRLISDRTVGQRAKGAGTVLLDHARQICREQGKTKLYSDCFAGPPDGLRNYYQANGFRVLGPFCVPAKHVDGTVWNGILLVCDVETQ